MSTETFQQQIENKADQTLKNEEGSILPCPFCGTQPVRRIACEILSVTCPKCVSVGFHNHVRFGCRADAEWNERQNTSKPTA